MIVSTNFKPSQQTKALTCDVHSYLCLSDVVWRCLLVISRVWKVSLMEGDGRMEVGLAWLLRAAWIAGTLPILVASIPSSRLSPVHGVLSGFASRGKTRQSSSQVCLRILYLSSFNWWFLSVFCSVIKNFLRCLKVLLLVVSNWVWFGITTMWNLNILIFQWNWSCGFELFKFNSNQNSLRRSLPVSNFQFHPIKCSLSICLGLVEWSPSISVALLLQSWSS